MRIGTIISANPNTKAKKPAYILEIDFGTDIGRKISSAQLTKNYTVENIIGRQITAVMNFEPMRIAGVKSEVLILGSMGEENDIVLLSPEKTVENGLKVG